MGEQNEAGATRSLTNDDREHVEAVLKITLDAAQHDQKQDWGPEDDALAKELNRQAEALSALGLFWMAKVALALMDIADRAALEGLARLAADRG